MSNNTNKVVKSLGCNLYADKDNILIDVEDMRFDSSYEEYSIKRKSINSQENMLKESIVRLMNYPKGIDIEISKGVFLTRNNDIISSVYINNIGHVISFNNDYVLNKCNGVEVRSLLTMIREAIVNRFDNVISVSDVRPKIHLIKPELDVVKNREFVKSNLYVGTLEHSFYFYDGVYYSTFAGHLLRGCDIDETILLKDIEHFNDKMILNGVLLSSRRGYILYKLKTIARSISWFVVAKAIRDGDFYFRLPNNKGFLLHVTNNTLWIHKSGELIGSYNLNLLYKNTHKHLGTFMREMLDINYDSLIQSFIDRITFVE